MTRADRDWRRACTLVERASDRSAVYAALALLRSQRGRAMARHWLAGIGIDPRAVPAARALTIIGSIMEGA